jgi:hypothetical protein
MLCRGTLEWNESGALLHVGGNPDRERPKELGIAENLSTQFMGSDQPMATIVRRVNNIARIPNQRFQQSLLWIYRQTGVRHDVKIAQQRIRHIC